MVRGAIGANGRARASTRDLTDIDHVRTLHLLTMAADVMALHMITQMMKHAALAAQV